MQSDAVKAEPLARMSTVSAGSRPADAARPRLVGAWLWCIAALVFAMVLVGGATRLTESGLSIVEWQPVTGVIPPLGDAAWRTAFAQYQEIPQYQRVNRGMSLDAFKTIYWWEWSHRLLGRIIGAVFVLPLLWFVWRGWVDRRLAAALAAIFALGAVQGAVGWWMVASGLSERVSVSQYRLAFHLTLACIIYVVLVWTADRILASARAGRERGGASASQNEAALGAPFSRRIALAAGILPALVLGQIYLGAIVAGLRAGLIYNTWPLIDGSFVPPAKNLFFAKPLWTNFFENTLTVQFDHRMLAYGIGAFALFHALDAWRNDRSGALAASAGIVMLAVVAQMAVGVLMLLRGAPIDLALVHQAMALVVLTAATLHASRALPSRPYPSLVFGRAEPQANR